MRLVLVVASLVTGSHVCWGFGGDINPAKAYDQEIQEAIGLVSPSVQLISKEAIQEKLPEAHRNIQIRSALNRGVSGNTYTPLGQLDLDNLRNLSTMFTATTPPHAHDGTIAIWSAQLYNLFQRHFAHNPTPGWDNLPSYANAKNQLLQAARLYDNGNPTAPRHLANTWAELVQHRLAYTENNEQSWQRAHALQTWLLPMAAWLAAQNPAWTQLVLSLDPDNNSASAVYNAFFVFVANCLKDQLGL